MTTSKQMTANRKNALQSTGPATISGKTRSAKNSLKHGLLAKDLIIRDEDPNALQDLLEELFRTLEPIGKLEEILVEKIAATLWRFQRLLAVESMALQENDYRGKLEDIKSCYNRTVISSINRNESTLEKSFYRALHELQRLQGMRQGPCTPAPIAVEINSNV